MAELELIDPALLVAVTGGEMQWHPGLLGTMDSLIRRNRSNKPDPRMTQAVTAIGTAMSNLTTSIGQSQQQSSQAMMQMLPQMMRR